MQDVQNVLLLHGKTFSEFNLPQPAIQVTQVPEYDEASELLLATEKRNSLNGQQPIAYDTILQQVLQQTFYKEVALSIHSLGYQFQSIKSVSRIKQDTFAGKQLNNANLLILDECTMAPKYALTLIDRLLHEVMTTNVGEKNEIPFGGKDFVIGGDFRQCLPVIPNGTRTDVIEFSLKMADLWKQFTKLYLMNNMGSSDPDNSNWLIKLSNGELSNQYKLGEDIIEIPEDMLCTDCINDDVALLNDRVMDRMPGEYKLYKSDDSVDVDNEDEREHYPVEFLNSVMPSGMPSHRLQLKVGTIVMLLRNLNAKNGLCNGTRLIVTGLYSHVVQAKVVTGSAKGSKVFIPRIDLCPSDTDLPFRLRRRQFPIKPAFAKTINKSQGQTLHRVGIYLPEPVFGHGQLYVAFSRVKMRSNVKVQVLDTPLQV
ncbi:ATP-dependent DNA helicase PIF1-like [Dendrobates tinctorius]|uniref:ATP-dependent DNA helicase PIF1-like n=1 Tax=Dendrobates tinctorius TaxID=92724 RepID=UPI003CC9DD3B